MPRYYSHPTDGKHVLNNHKGIDLPGNAAARDDALALARDLKDSASATLSRASTGGGLYARSTRTALARGRALPHAACADMLLGSSPEECAQY
jgi:hypothetical protein